MIALLLCAVIAEPVPIKLWHSYSNAERAGLEKAIAALSKAEPQLRVEPSFVPYDTLADKLTAAIPHGHGPDLFIFAHDRLGGWVEGGLVEPIELFVDEPLLDRHLTACIFALAYGDSLYGLPLAFKALALYVRTDRVPKPPQSFEELLAIAKRETDPKRQRYGLFYSNADFFFHTPLLFSLGGTIFSSSDATEPKLVNDGVIRSLALAHRLAKEERVLPEDPSPVFAGPMFNEGRVPLVINGPWFRSEIDPKTPYTVVPIPAFPGGEPSSGFSSCEGILMSRTSSHKREAFRAMRFLTSELASAELRMIVGRQTVTLEEAFEKVVPQLDPKEQQILRAFREAFVRSKTSPSQPSMNAVWTPMNGALSKAIHQDFDPAAAVQEAQERIDRGLSPSGG